MPSTSSASGGASAAHSPIAVKDVAPVNAAATAVASTEVSECRTPRGSRGSGTPGQLGDELRNPRSESVTLHLGQLGQGAENSTDRR
jgi:hypothetical protein